MSSPEDHLPLKPLALHILLMLAEREHHGYSLMQALAEHPEVHATVHTGPLYRALKRLLDDGLIRERATPPAGDRGDTRRGSYYTLAALGRRVLEAELARMARVVRVGRQLGVTGGR